MNSWPASSPGITSHPAFGAEEPRPSIDLTLVCGVALLALGAGLFGFGLFHAFSHGSCSTTGYSAHYGPVQRCPGGIGWWMAVIMAGIIAALAGGALFGTSGAMIVVPLLFVAIGAPFIALALRSGNIQLMQGSSAHTGKIFAGAFGGCFALAGLVWGAFAGVAAFSDVGARSRLAGAAMFAAGVAAAALIATGVSGAIGKQSTPPSVVTSPFSAPASVPASAPSSVPASATPPVPRTVLPSAAVTQIRTAEKLAACVRRAGSDVTRIEACQVKYVP